MKWIKTTQKSVPLLSRYIATKYALGRYISESRLHQIPVQHYKYVNDNRHVQAFFRKEDLDKLYPALWNTIESGEIHAFLEDYHECGLELLSFCRVVKHMNVKEASNKALFSIFNQWVQQYTRFIGFIYNGNFTINASTEHLLEKLGKTEEDEEFRLLTEPEQTTDISKRQKRIVNLLNKVEERENPFAKVLELPRPIKNELVAIHEAYRYLGSIFLTTNTYPYLEDFIEELHQSDPALLKKDEDLKKRKQEIIHQKGLDEKTISWCSTHAELGYWRTELLSYVQKAEYDSVGLFEEIAKRLELSFKHLVHLTDEEIQKGLITGTAPLPKEAIEERFENFFVELKNGQVTLTAPEKKEQQAKNATKVKGMCASPGQTRGKVTILRNSSELFRMQKGAVLVTFMTTPDYVPAMQKASAIVTNDGGMTCHAAIVSRELGKPCIVGTRNATEILNDGDIVNVDATKGVVRILQRKQET